MERTKYLILSDRQTIETLPPNTVIMSDPTLALDLSTHKQISKLLIDAEYKGLQELVDKLAFASERQTTNIPTIIYWNSFNDAHIDLLDKGLVDDILHWPTVCGHIDRLLELKGKHPQERRQSRPTKYGDIEIDTKRLTISCRSIQRKLSLKNMNGFLSLIFAKGKLLKIAEFTKLVWTLKSDSTEPVSKKAIDRQIQELRKILQQVQSDVKIQAIYGKGFKMSHEPKDDQSINVQPSLKKVLIVDDSTMNCELAQAICRSLSIDSQYRVDGKHAVELFQKEEFDLILMDCQMPILDGYQATLAIRDIESRQNHKRTPITIIGLTATLNDQIKLKCLESGMNDAIKKPITVDILRTILQSLNPLGTQTGTSVQQKQAHQTFDNDRVIKFFEPLESFDSKYIQEIIAISREDPRPFLKRILGLFRDRTPNEVAKLETSASPEEIKKIAHKLRGMAENIGAHSLGEACAKLEDLTHPETVPGQITANLITTIKTLHKRVMDDINHIDSL